MATTKQPRRIVKVIGAGLIALILMAVIELASYVALRFGIIPADSTLVYTPAAVDPDLFEDYLDYRHPTLGWATPTEERKFSAVHESRPNLNFPDTDVSCVSTYGDSFTFGSEVGDAEAWGNVLSELLDCKVSNFGVDGYGMDQAYLRYTLNDVDESPINVLGIYPYNVLRNLNQYRPFLAGPYASEVGLKPRFTIEDDQLKLIPPLYFSHDELVDTLNDPQDEFPHETFLPGSTHGPVLFKFPYSFTIFRIAKSQTVQNYLSKKPSYSHFFEKDHPTNAINIAEKITQKFARVAQERNHQFLVLLYPTVSSYKYYKRTDTLATQALPDVLQSSNIDFIDLHKHFSDYIGERDYCELLTDLDGCSGHYNAEGNRIVAKILAQKISAMKAYNGKR